MEDSTIFVGGKPFMNYVTGVVVQFTSKNSPEVTIKSRGKYISKAVDVAEVARRKFLSEQKVYVKEVKIGSEEFKNEDGKSVNVSTIEIALSKKSDSSANASSDSSSEPSSDSQSE